MTSPSGRTSASDRLGATGSSRCSSPSRSRSTALQRLSGGASRETWSFTADGHDLILRRDPPGRPGAPGSMRAEADAMRACDRAGLARPRGARRRRRQRARHRRAGHARASPARRSHDASCATTSSPSARDVLVRRTRRVPRGPARNRSRRGTRCAARPTRLAQYWQAYSTSTTCSPTFEKAYAVAGRAIVRRARRRRSSTATSAWAT